MGLKVLGVNSFFHGGHGELVVILGHVFAFFLCGHVFTFTLFLCGLVFGLLLFGLILAFTLFLLGLVFGLLLSGLLFTLTLFLLGLVLGLLLLGLILTLTLFLFGLLFLLGKLDRLDRGLSGFLSLGSLATLLSLFLFLASNEALSHGVSELFFGDIESLSGLVEHLFESVFSDFEFLAGFKDPVADVMLVEVSVHLGAVNHALDVFNRDVFLGSPLNGGVNILLLEVELGDGFGNVILGEFAVLGFLEDLLGGVDWCEGGC